MRAVPTSAKTETKLIERGIPCVSAATHAAIDVAIGSADAVDSQGNVIKGGKGALLREKLVHGTRTCSCRELHGCTTRIHASDAP